MAVSRGLELQPEYGPKVAVGIPKAIGETPDAAVSYLRMAGGALVKLDEWKAYIAVNLGRQLIEIRDGKYKGKPLWASIERRDLRDPDHPEGIPRWSSDEREKFYFSFEDFLEQGGPLTIGYSGRQLHNFIRLADKKSIQNFSDYDLQQMRSTRNLMSIARVEEAMGPEAITPAMVHDAKTLDNPTFQKKWAVPQPVYAGSVPEASDKQFVMSHFVGRLSAEELQVLKTVVADGLVRCQDSASDLLSLMCSLLAEVWEQDDARVAESQNPIQTEAEFVNGKTVEVEPEPVEDARAETVSGGLEAKEYGDRW